MFQFYSKKPELITEISNHLNPFLKEGRTYFQDIIIAENEIEETNFFFIDEGIRYNYQFIVNNRHSEYISDVNLLEQAMDNPIYKSNLKNLYHELPDYTKLRVCYQKDKTIQIMIFGINELLANIANVFENCSQEGYSEENPLLSIISIIRFEKHTDKLLKIIDSCEESKNKIKTYSYFKDNKLLDCFYVALNKRLKKLYLYFENGKLSAQSLPAFPEFGLNEINNDKSFRKLDCNDASRKQNRIDWNQL
jgi:hypothetical protein